MTDERRSFLFILSKDVSVPLGCTVPYYVIDELAESHTVHVLCRKQPERRSDGSPPRGAVRHELDVGDVPVLSSLLFFVASALFAAVIALRHRFDAVYAYQNELVQGWIAGLFGDSRFVANLQSVPVRQSRDFSRSRAEDPSPRARVALALYSVYARVVGSALDAASDVFCLTAGIRDVTADAYGVDLSDAHVFGMGIDTEKFAVDGQSGDAPLRTNGSERSTSPDWTVTYVGSIHETRELEDVVEAVAATDRDVEFRIAGTGPDADVAALRARARDLGVHDRVTFLGLVDHDRIPALLNETDVAVSPLPDIESFRISFPAKLLEYMAADCVVVASDIRPHRRLIDDGENGFLYAGGSDGLLRALERCLDDARRHGAVSERASETARRYEWDRIVERQESVVFS